MAISTDPPVAVLKKLTPRSGTRPTAPVSPPVNVICSVAGSENMQGATAIRAFRRFT